MAQHLNKLRQLFQNLKMFENIKLFPASWSENSGAAKPVKINFSGNAGDGEGKGGGAGGSIRSAGGSFGKREAALEDKYMHDEEMKHLKEFKTKMLDFYRNQLRKKEQKLLTLSKDLKSAQDAAKKEIQETIRKTEGDMKKIHDKMKDLEKTSE